MWRSQPPKLAPLAQSREPYVFEKQFSETPILHPGHLLSFSYALWPQGTSKLSIPYLATQGVFVSTSPFQALNAACPLPRTLLFPKLVPCLLSLCPRHSMLIAALAYGHILASIPHRAGGRSPSQPETPFTTRTKKRAGTRATGP